MAFNIRLPEEEVAKIFSNRSLVFAKLGNASEALQNAEQCIALQPQWWKVSILQRFVFSSSSSSFLVH